MNKKTIQALLQFASNRLENTSDSPLLDAELLLCHCINKDRSYLYTWPEKEINASQQQCFESMVQKRATDYPVAYLLGKKAFWDLELIVSEDVLIPRPETELVVETALEKIKHTSKPNILDLGTGSGAIALAIASERPDAVITATDVSARALEIAKKNSQKYDFKQRIILLQSDWFSAIEDSGFDLIASNPPYISEQDSHLSNSIRYEPRSALVAKDEGLEDIKQIVTKSKAYLKPKGWIIIEHGYDQSKDVQDTFEEKGFYNIDTLIDLQKNPRITLGQYNIQ